jgi:hypothetical protein
LWWGRGEGGWRKGGRGLFWDAREVTKLSSIVNLESFGKKIEKWEANLETTNKRIIWVP